MDDYYGLSPISSAATDIDQHNLANKHNVNLLQNGARPSGAVIFKPKDQQVRKYNYLIYKETN